MIIIFHCVASFIYKLLKKLEDDKDSAWKNFTLTQLNLKNFHPLAERNDEHELKFNPPVFKQRYERATQVLLEETWKNSIHKVVEFGCAEYGLFIFLKNSLNLHEISFVDVNEPLLRDYLFKLYPLNADYLVRRPEKLVVKVFTGSVSNPEPSIQNTDVVIALELIEHLYPDVLEALPYNVFSYIQPKLVIITTPNCEFNVLFKKQNQFRHADHKFEWDRSQFQEWASNITVRFPLYTVRFDGIGHGPYGSEHLGCCSQLAVFIRKDIVCDNYLQESVSCTCIIDSTCKLNREDSGFYCVCKCRGCLPSIAYGICTYNTLSKYLTPHNVSEAEKSRNSNHYKLMTTIEYPFEVDLRSEEDKLLDELKYRVFILSGEDGVFFVYDKNRTEIPLGRLNFGKLKDVSPVEMRHLLAKSDFKIEECTNHETNQTETCLIVESEMETSDRSTNDTDASGYESDNNKKYSGDDLPASDWDLSPPSNSQNWSPESLQDGQIVVAEVPKSQLHLEVGGSRSKQGALIDSGYQKSPPSISSESPPPPPTPPPLPPPVVVGAVNVKPPPHDKPHKLSNILSVFDNFDKINELDNVRREKKYFNFSSNLPRKEVMRKICKEIAKHPIAGPSRDKSKSPKKSQSSDSEESVEEVKSITTCILENTLNTIECPVEQQQPPIGRLIQEVEELAAQPEPEHVFLEPVLVVENGDLANNNRDREGNNYPAEDANDDENLQQINDELIDNMEANNVNIDNNNEVDAEVVEEVPAAEVEEDPVEVEWPSREAICDGNSHVDLLDDFDMDLAGIAFQDQSTIEPEDFSNDASALLPDESGFPNWLLQIFQEADAAPPEDDLHDEPHFYCQGDGLGVHPSTVAVNDDDDDDDEGNESGSDTSSNSGSADFTSNAQNSTSVQELFMTPEGSRNEENFVVVGQSLEMEVGANVTIESSGSDIFENAQDSESNLSDAN